MSEENKLDLVKKLQKQRMKKVLSDEIPYNTKEQQKEARVQKIQELLAAKQPEIVREEKDIQELKEDDDLLLQHVIEFNEWMNKRTYLKGDLLQIERWVANLVTVYNQRIKEAEKQDEDLVDQKKQLIKRYKEVVPLDFLEDGMRIALNKKIRGQSRTTSDNYYLRKLRELARKTIKEAKYYEILQRLVALR